MPDRAALLKLCKHAAREMKSGEFGEGIAVMVEILDRQPDVVADLVELVVAESNKKRPSDVLMATLTFLIGHGLEFIRYRTERRLAGALALADRLRDTLLALGRDGRMQPPVLLMVLSQFIHAKLEMGEPLRELMGQLAAGATAEATEDAEVEAGTETSDAWADAVEMAEDDAFLLFTQMFSHAGAFPAAQRKKMGIAMLHADQALVREAAIGWLLDGASEVRTAVAGELAPLSAQGMVSGVMLRRAVSIRNWLPQADQPSLDEGIRACRQRGVSCASWPTPTVSEILVSPFDGSGTQTVFVATRTKRRYSACCLLINLDVGARDAWVQPDLTRRELDALLQEVANQLDLYRSSPAYLGKAIAHGLGVSIAAGALPPFSILQFAEAAGVGDLNPHITDTDELIAMLCGGSDAKAVAAGSEDGSPMGLVDLYPFFDSWFEEDDEVDALLVASPPDARVQYACDAVLAPRRGRWAGMLAWTAFALRDAGDEFGWRGLAEAARDLANGQPIAEIPVMHAVATATVDVFAQRQGERG
jgi:hypothetical protein